MKNFIKVYLWLIAAILLSCNKLTDPIIPENEFTKYENRYNILFRHGVDLYSIYSDGTHLVRLTNSDAVKQHATWSPDGSKIAFDFSSDLITTDIRIMNSDGTNIRTISHNFSVAQYPQFTADGKRIIFHGSDQITERLYSLNIDGSNQFPLQTESDYILNDFDVHPLEDKVVFQTRKNDTCCISEFDIATSLSHKIFEGENYIGDLIYSCDGLKIAYTTTGTTPVSHRDIYIINTDGSGKYKLTNFTSPYPIRMPVWSPDDSRIVFHVRKGDEYPLYVINTDGSNLTEIASYGRGQSWSPDITRISYWNFDTEIIIYDVETGSKTKLTDGYDIEWSKTKI